MSLTMITGMAPDGFISSLPDYVSFAIQDDGSGGSLWINGLGVNGGPIRGGDTVTDLKTFFVGNSALFRAVPLLLAFRRLHGKVSYTNDDAQAQFLAFLNVVITPLVSTPQSNEVPALWYGVNQSSNGAGDVPYFGIQGIGDGETGAGIWRVDMRLRHSITN